MYFWVFGITSWEIAMAYRGFTIQDQLHKINVSLNIPPFLNGQGQLPASDVLEGRRIASV